MLNLKFAPSSVTLRFALLAALYTAAAVGAFAQGAPDLGEKARSVLRLEPRHATISVANLQVETRWYVEKLGFAVPATPRADAPGGKIRGVQLSTPGYQIHLIQFEGSTRARTPSPRLLVQGWLHLAFTVADADAAYAFLKSAGTDVTGTTDGSGKMETLVLHDPEGNEIELFARGARD